MFSTAAIDVERRGGCSVYAHAPSRPRSSEFQAANSTLPLRPLALFRRERVRLGDLEQRHRARSVVVGAVEDLRRVRAVVIEVRRHDHPFVLQPRVAPFEEREDVAVRHDVTVDRRLQLDRGRPAAAIGVNPRARLGRRATSSSSDFPVPADERRRQRRRDLRDRNANAIGPGRERVVQDPRRLLGPEVSRRRLEVRRRRDDCARR